jgi:hypothetical protein
MDDVEPVYNVEAIVARRKQRSGAAKAKSTDGYEYHIKWFNFPDSDNTWEPRDCLDGCASLSPPPSLFRARALSFSLSLSLSLSSSPSLYCHGNGQLLGSTGGIGWGAKEFISY